MSEVHFDLTGIYNQNEYFTNHYFASSFYEDDAVKSLLSKWQNEQQEDKKKKSPWAMLGETGRKFYAAHEKYNRSRFNQGHLALIQEMADAYLHALGYEDSMVEGEIEIPVSDTMTAPVYRAVKKANGAPLLWVILAAALDDDDENILSANPIFTGRISDNDLAAVTEDILPQVKNEDLVNQVFFGNRAEQPRFVMLISIDQIILLDRNKWGDKKYFSFDLAAVFGRHELTTLKAMAVLLHKDSLCPAEEKPLLDTLDAASYRNANAVSDDLKYALRESIELLGNEVLYYYRNHDDGKYKAEDIDAADLSIQCVRYMYRLLFLFFMESRPELGYAPVKENTYLSAYSIESLRSIAEKVRPEDMVGDNYYFSDTLSTLFDMIYNGYPGNDRDLRKCEENKSSHDIFVIHPLKAHIFDRERTPLLYHARLRDEVMIRIINLMSLTRDRGNKKQRRGRISYANLGINQIGSVYEALLSYRGFIAKEKLYEVQKAGEDFNQLDVGYFVPESQIEDYSEDERVRYESGPMKKKPRTYEKGTFIYRLAGREREKSASYYTPESLTKCLVKYALKELLKNKKADDILHLKICEPAMGSAAFLNEAINQLAEAYINKKQEELGDTISYAQRARELQKVKMYIADENVYGVDLNPTAVELAEVSLWLNTIYSGGYVPWFRTQLVNGNSLIGARRECYRIPEIIKVNNESSAAAKARLWYYHAPERILPGKRRDTGDQIYHFLLGDPGMASYTDKVIKGLEKENIDRIKKWNKEFTEPYSMDEIGNLLNLSRLVDQLWEKQVLLRRKIDELTKDRLAIYPEKDRSVEQRHTIREKDDIFEKYYLSAHEKDAGAYARLKFAMDYWCALWFWPVTKADLLPTRGEFINDMFLILEGTIRSKGKYQPVREYVTSSLFENDPSSKKEEVLYEDSLFTSGMVKRKEDEELEALLPESGGVNLDQLCQLFPRLALVREIADKNKFLHWELEFADVFAEKNGFDLIVGNPPWLSLEWKLNTVIADFEPIITIHSLNGIALSVLREETLSKLDVKKTILSEYEEVSGQQNFMKSPQCYPDLKGVKSDLYKSFLPVVWYISTPKGVIGLLHPANVFNDSKGAHLRSLIYRKLRMHFQFINQKKIFPIGNTRSFSINIYSYDHNPNFDAIFYLFSPSTIDDCFTIKSNHKTESGIKDANGNWNENGDSTRVIRVNSKVLKSFVGLFDDKEDFLGVKMPFVYSKQVISTFEKIKNAPQTLKDIDNDIISTEMFIEPLNSTSLIKQDSQFAKGWQSLLLCGPNINISNPFYKTACKVCNTPRAYDPIDLTNITADYFPRSKYSFINKDIHICDVREVDPNIRKSVMNYRIAARKMVDTNTERTLISTIIPPGAVHMDSIYSLAIHDLKKLVLFQSALSSLPYDFLAKLSGKSILRLDFYSSLPINDLHITNERILRVLLLNCINKDYSPLWKYCWNDDFCEDSWSYNDNRLKESIFKQLNSNFNPDMFVKSDFARRELLVENDVLNAMALGISLNELKTIYRLYFPVLKQNEANTWFDANGRIVFTTNRGLTNVGFSRKEWENGIKGAPAGKKFYRTIQDDTMPGGPVERTIEYVAPFDRCDREKDYETAWKFFEQKYGK